MNPNLELATVHKNTQIATLEPLQEQADESATEISAIQSEDLPEDKKQMLWVIVVKCGEDLSEEQKKTFYLLLIAYNDVFAMSKQDVGQTKILKHSISVGNVPPI